MDIFGAPREARQALRAAFQEDYLRADANWRALEAKAQATIPVVGIFAGFALNYAKELQASTNWIIRLTTILTVGLLSASVVYAAVALRVRKIVTPPTGQFYRELAEDYANVGANGKRDYLPALEKNEISEWERAVVELQKANDRKAKRIVFSQFLLFASIIAAGVLAAATAIFPKSAAVPADPIPTIYEVHQERLRLPGH